MKKLFLIAIVIASVAMLAACKKIELGKDGNKPIFEKVQLNFSQSEMKAKGVVVSGQTINGNVNYFFSFWLTPAPDTKGIFEITSADQIVTYYSSAVAENAIDWRAPAVGTYKLNVSGTYNNQSFSYTNITINVTDNYVPPVSNTDPVRFYNPTVNSNLSMVTIDVAVAKGSYTTSPHNWFHVKRMNGLNFIGNQAVVNENDSVRFSLSFPSNNGTYVEFMTGMADGSAGGLWLTPSSYPGCLLYSGSPDNPYNGSGNFFGFRLIVSGNHYEFQSLSGEEILSFSSGTGTVIPGEAGDGSFTNYQVRWTGFTHWVKTGLSNPILRYKLGTSGSWTYASLSQFPNNNSYWSLTFPSNTSGELFFQWGTGNSDGNFVPATNEIQNSMYFVSSLGLLAKNI